MVFTGLECKRIFRCLPVLCLQSAVLCAVLLALVTVGDRALNRDRLRGRIRVGVLNEEEDPLTGYALDMLWSMEGLKDSCDLIKIEDIGQAGELDALIVLPSGMIRGILDGENIPARVYLYGRDGIRQILLEELVRSGVTVLSTAQAQIYSAHELLTVYGMADRQAEVQEHINLANLNMALGHRRLFRDVELEATGELGESVHFASSVVALFLLLMGLNCCFFTTRENRELERQLGRRGYTAVFRVSARIASISAFLAVCLAVFLFLLKLCLRLLPEMGRYIELSRGGLPGLFLLLLSVSSVLTWALEYADGVTGAVTLPALGGFALLFVAGGFIPEVFLPDAVRAVGRFLPGGELIRMASGLFTGRTAPIPGGKLAAYLGFFWLTAAWRAQRRTRV